jgi:23S rRNA U2552 (ribose-2'-O)-methylase RlmE/FtsJ
MNIKTNLWNIMRNISSTYYYLDKFERQKDDKFIENTDELSKVGHEMFKAFNINKEHIFFIDICGAPGMYSKILVEDKKAKGFSISLPPEKGGVEYIFKHDNYKIYYKDILEKSYKIETERKINFGVASCVSYIESKNSSILNMELIIKSMSLILSILENDGDMIINMTMKNIYNCFNILDLLLKQFDKIKLWKSENVWSTKNTFYIFCYGFNKKIDMTKYIDDIKNEKSDFNTKYIGDTNNLKKINNMMSDIYKIRINAWLNLIGDKDLH